MYIPMGYTCAAVNKHDPSRGREAAVFKSNRSQAVRIPKEFAFATIERTADGGLVIKPVRDPAKAWEEYFRNGPFLTDDFDVNFPDPPPEDVISFDD